MGDGVMASPGRDREHYLGSPHAMVPWRVMGYPNLITDALGSRQGVGSGHIGIGAQCEPTEE